MNYIAEDDFSVDLTVSVEELAVLYSKELLDATSKRFTEVEKRLSDTSNIDIQKDTKIQQKIEQIESKITVSIPPQK